MVKDNLSSHLDLIHQWKRFTRNPVTTRCYSGGGPFSISIQKWHGSVSSQFGHCQFQFTSSPQLKNSDQYGRVGPKLASSEICSFASAAILATSQGTLKLSQVPTTDYSDSQESSAFLPAKCTDYTPDFRQILFCCTPLYKTRVVSVEN